MAHYDTECKHGKPMFEYCSGCDMDLAKAEKERQLQRRKELKEQEPLTKLVTIANSSLFIYKDEIRMADNVTIKGLQGKKLLVKHSSAPLSKQEVKKVFKFLAEYLNYEIDE